MEREVRWRQACPYIPFVLVEAGRIQRPLSELNELEADRIAPLLR